MALEIKRLHLAGLDMSPADITMVINTHLHFDHCGQNAVFKHAAFHIQRGTGPGPPRVAGPLVRLRRRPVRVGR